MNSNFIQLYLSNSLDKHRIVTKYESRDILKFHLMHVLDMVIRRHIHFNTKKMKAIEELEPHFTKMDTLIKPN